MGRSRTETFRAEQTEGLVSTWKSKRKDDEQSCAALYSTSEQQQRKQQKDLMILLSMVRPTGTENVLDSEVFVKYKRAHTGAKEETAGTRKHKEVL